MGNARLEEMTPSKAKEERRIAWHEIRTWGGRQVSGRVGRRVSGWAVRILSYDSGAKVTFWGWDKGVQHNIKTGQ